MNKMVFSLVCSEIPVVMETTPGKTEDFVLKEMSAGERDRYLDSMRSRMQMDPQGKVLGVKNFDGMHADLVARCLHRASDGKTLTLDTIQKWPGGVVATLFTEAQKLNKLEGKAEAVEPKKD